MAVSSIRLCANNGKIRVRIKTSSEERSEGRGKGGVGMMGRGEVFNWKCTSKCLTYLFYSMSNLRVIFVDCLNLSVCQKCDPFFCRTARWGGGGLKKERHTTGKKDWMGGAEEGRKEEVRCWQPLRTTCHVRLQSRRVLWQTGVAHFALQSRQHSSKCVF